MNPEDEFRRLRDPALWNEMTPRAQPEAPKRRRPALVPDRVRGAIATAVVALIVLAAFIGATHIPHAQPGTTSTPPVTPTQTSTPTSAATDPAATATVRGAEKVHTLVVHGAGKIGSQSVDAATAELRALFGRAVRGSGGYPSTHTVFVLITRAPSAAETATLRRMPWTTRVHWSNWPSDATLQKLWGVAFSTVLGFASEQVAAGDSETNATTISYWPTRGSALTPQHVASLAAKAARVAAHGPLPFDITVLDESRTAQGIADRTSHTRTVARNGTTLLVGDHSPFTDFQMRAIGTLATDRSHCVTLGGRVLIAPPKSSISEDGQSIKLTGIGEVRIGDSFGAIPNASRPVDSSSVDFSSEDLTAQSAASYLPLGAGACSTGPFVIAQR